MVVYAVSFFEDVYGPDIFPVVKIFKDLKKAKKFMVKYINNFLDDEDYILTVDDIGRYDKDCYSLESGDTCITCQAIKVDK